MKMRPRIAAVLVAAVTVWIGWGVFIFRPAPNALAACIPNGPLACTTIDGFPLGTLVQDCGGQSPGQSAVCGDNAKLALDGLPPWDSLHPAVVHSSEYALDMARFCGPVLCARSGGYRIFVFEFADGSRHAIGLSCPGIAACAAVQVYTPGPGG